MIKIHMDQLPTDFFMNRYKKWINELEYDGYLKSVNIKTVQDFKWGFEFIGLDEDGTDPYLKIFEYNYKNILNSHKFFTPEKLQLSEYSLENNILVFPSTICTHVSNNNTVKMPFFPSKNKDNVIIVIPHWNASHSVYDSICLKLQRIGFSALRMTLPYHDIRSNGQPDSSTLMVSSNVGLTIQAMQQSVQDILSAVSWLDLMGYKKIGIMGSSLGSCSGFIAACHDSRIHGFFANLMSSSFGDVVWTGLSTTHIKKSFDEFNLKSYSEIKLSQEKVREFWLINSPISYIDKIKVYNPKLRLRVISGRYDSTFHFQFTKEIIDAFKQKKIKYNHCILPCGHYSLGRSIFKYIDAIYIFTFFRKLFN